MRKIRYLSREEEYTLALRMRAGDTKARNELVMSHAPLVGKIARWYGTHYPSIKMRDLFQTGMFALLEHAIKFEPERGLRFATFMVYWIRNDMRQLCFANPTVTIPDHKMRMLHSIRKATARIAQKKGRKATTREIARATGQPEAQVEEIKNLNLSIFSFDAPIGEGEETRLDFFSDREGLSPEEMLIEKEKGEEAQIRLNRLLTKLETDSRISDRERDMFKSYLGLGTGEPSNLEKVAVRHHLSRERVRQLIDKVAFVLLGGEKKNGKIKLKVSFNPLEVQAAARELYSS